MPDLSSITLPDNTTYNIKDSTARALVVTNVPALATIDNNGLITFKNSSGTALFTLQLPIYTGTVS